MNEIQINHAREVTLKIIDLKRKTASNFVELGRLFKDVRDNKLWEIEGAESFNSYVSESGFERSTAYKMILVYEKFFEGVSVDSNQQIAEIGWTKLAKVAPKVTEDNKEKMLEIAQLSLSDIKTELSGECDHEWKTIEVCKFCGKRK